jgi:NDP-4-keto-2,6-dideoxyhexose 3-C-methyltransferase
MSSKKISVCRVCGNKNLVEVLHLGEQALTGVFPTQASQPITVGPLNLVKCHGDGDICHLLQLQHDYDLSEMYGENYGYRSGLNPSMVRHLQAKVQRILRMVSLVPGDLVIDIGSNDGTTLGFYPEGPWDLLGMDPTGKKFSRYYKPHLKLITEFFSGEKVREKMGNRKAKIVTSFSMFYDLPDPLLFAKDVAEILAQDGIWVLEQSYMPEMIAKTSYDTVCHEHLEYYGLTQIAWIADKAGLVIIDVEFNEINGGSFSVVAALKSSRRKPKTKKINELLSTEEEFKTLNHYNKFADDVASSRTQLLAFLREINQSGKVVYGMGASTKGNVILQYCGITTDLLPAIGEVNEEKYGKFTPGSLIPIVAEEEVINRRPDYLLILPWHFHQFFENSEIFKNTTLIYPMNAVKFQQ